MFSLRKLPQNLFNVLYSYGPNLRQPRHRKPSWKIELMILIFFKILFAILSPYEIAVYLPAVAKDYLWKLLFGLMALRSTLNAEA